MNLHALTAVEFLTIAAASWTILAVAAGVPIGRGLRRNDRAHIYLPEPAPDAADWLVDVPVDCLAAADLDDRFYAIVADLDSAA